VVGLALAEAVVVVGAVALLRWRRAGAWVVAVGLLLDAVGNVLVVIAFLKEGPVATGTMARSVADVVTRLVLLGLVALVLLPRLMPKEAADDPIAAPAP
jgi:hypothetical protein